MRDLGAGQLRDLVGKIDQAMRLGHLVEDADPFALLRRIDHRELDAADGILNVDEGAGLATGPVDVNG